MKKLMAVAMVMALACGCASNGRVAVVDWDSREAAQIQAAQYEAGCIYGDEQQEQQTEKAGFSAWAELFDMITKLRVRIRVISVEWAAK